MKYTKPISRNLSDLVLASGVCGSGAVVSERCWTGGINVGPCSGGTQAGYACSNGTTPSQPTAPCVNGHQATQCENGNFAGLVE